MNSIDPAIRYFHALTRDEQRDAIKRMAREGWSDHGLAAAARISVETVREILAEAVKR